jgi:hypothetical protein
MAKYSCENWALIEAIDGLLDKFGTMTLRPDHDCFCFFFVISRTGGCMGCIGRMVGR